MTHGLPSPSELRNLRELYRYRDDGEECPLCGGTGTIVTNSTWNNDPQHDHEQDCPVCTEDYRDED